MSAEQRSLWEAPEPAEPDRPMDPAAPPPIQAAPRILRVSDLNRRVRQLLDSDPSLADVWVEGEVSQPSFPPSGHCFFTLKDAQSQIRAVLFREELSVANVRPEHGMQVIVHGRLRAYEPQGVYQLYVLTLTPAGAGDLHQRYEQLRAKLAAEGLFDDARKRALPRWPELAALCIVRERLEYRYSLPPDWEQRVSPLPGALSEVARQLWPLLVDLTGTVVVQRLAQIPELRERGILPAGEERP